MNEQHTVGPEKVSVIVTRKTKGDLVQAQFTSERWFIHKREADEAVTQVQRIFSEGVDAVRADAVFSAWVHRREEP